MVTQAGRAPPLRRSARLRARLVGRGGRGPRLRAGTRAAARRADAFRAARARSRGEGSGAGRALADRRDDQSGRRRQAGDRSPTPAGRPGAGRHARRPRARPGRRAARAATRGARSPARCRESRARLDRHGRGADRLVRRESGNGTAARRRRAVVALAAVRGAGDRRAGQSGLARTQRAGRVVGGRGVPDGDARRGRSRGGEVRLPEEAAHRGPVRARRSGGRDPQLRCGNARTVAGQLAAGARHRSGCARAADSAPRLHGGSGRAGGARHLLRRDASDLAGGARGRDRGAGLHRDVGRRHDDARPRPAPLGRVAEVRRADAARRRAPPIAGAPDGSAHVDPRAAP